MRPEDRRALTIGAIAIVAGVGFAFGVRPAVAQLAQKHQQLEEQHALLVRERALLAGSMKLLGAQREMDKAMASESNRLFPGDSVSAMAALTSFAADAAIKAAVRLTTLEGRQPRAKDGVIELAVEMRGEGTWRDVLYFIRALESADRLVHLGNVRIERGARGGPLGGALVSVGVTVVGYARGAR